MDEKTQDRAAGTLLAGACGDALRVGTEFLSPDRIAAPVGMIGAGGSQCEPGEWTDDTSIAWVLANHDLLTTAAQDLIAEAARRQPDTYPENGWVVAALMAAWSALTACGKARSWHTRRS